MIRIPKQIYKAKSDLLFTQFMYLCTKEKLLQWWGPKGPTMGAFVPSQKCWKFIWKFLRKSIWNPLQKSVWRNLWKSPWFFSRKKLFKEIEEICLNCCENLLGNLFGKLFGNPFGNPFRNPSGDTPKMLTLNFPEINF